MLIHVHKHILNCDVSVINKRENIVIISGLSTQLNYILSKSNLELQHDISSRRTCNLLFCKQNLRIKMK